MRRTESASSLMWTVLYDMLLECGTLTMAFADDLCYGCNENFGLLQADWLSAFCACTGLQLRSDKINSEICKLNDLREEGKLGELFERLTNDPPNTLDYQTLPSAEHG